MQSRDLLDTLMAEDQSRTQENRRMNEEQAIKKSLAPAQWLVLSNEVADQVEAIREVSPARLAFEADGRNFITVRNLRTAQLASLRFDATVPCVHYETPQQGGHLWFRVSPDGTMLQFMDETTPRRAEELATRLIRAVLGVG